MVNLRVIDSQYSIYLVDIFPHKMADKGAQVLRVTFNESPSFNVAMKIYNALPENRNLTEMIFFHSGYSAKKALEMGRLDLLEAGQKLGVLRDEDIADMLNYALSIMDSLKLADEIAEKFPLTSESVTAMLGEMLRTSDDSWIYSQHLLKLAKEIDKEFPSTPQLAEGLAAKVIKNREFVRLGRRNPLLALYSVISQAPNKYDPESLDRIELLGDRALKAMEKLGETKSYAAIFWVAEHIPLSQGLNTILIRKVDTIIMINISLPTLGGSKADPRKYPLLASALNNMPWYSGERWERDIRGMKQFENSLEKFAPLVKAYKDKYGLASSETDVRFYRDDIAYIDENVFGKEGQRLLDAYENMLHPEMEQQRREAEEKKKKEEQLRLREEEKKKKEEQLRLREEEKKKEETNKLIRERFEQAAAAGGRLSELSDMLRVYGREVLDIWAAFHQAMVNDKSQTAMWLADQLEDKDITKLDVELLLKQLERSHNEAAAEWVRERFAKYL